MRLGLTGASPARGANAGFRFAASLKGDLLPFDKAGESGRPPIFDSAGASTDEAASSLRRRGAAAAPGTEPFVPPKFALAGQKLTFKGFFQEGVPESSVETSRKRHLVVMYYLEDDTAEIVEPFVRNNGLPPGRFLKRMSLPDISPETLRVGNIIEVFSRSIRLYECDDFTRVRTARGARGGECRGFGLPAAPQPAAHARSSAGARRSPPPPSPSPSPPWPPAEVLRRPRHPAAGERERRQGRLDDPRGAEDEGRPERLPRRQEQQHHALHRGGARLDAHQHEEGHGGQLQEV
jgi:hypothetical protein